MKDKITLLIADDHEVIRMGISQIFSGHPKIEVIGTASSGREAVDLARKLNPDVVLLDITMPELNGIQACSLITAANPHTRVVMFSMYENEAYAHQALSVGACGYVIKTSTGQELVEAIEKAGAGQYYFSPKIGADIIKQYLAPNSPQAVNQTKYDLLSEREQQIFRLVVEGFSSRKIGELIYISPRTVDKHRSNIMKKLEINDSMELVRFALKIGVIDPELWSRR